MVFKNETILKEDEQRYGIGGVWAIDRERGVFLIGCGYGKERERPFKLYFIGEEKPVEISGYEFWEGQKPGEHVVRNEILNIRIPPSIKAKYSMKEITDLLIEAITEYQYGYPVGRPFRLENVSVTINFSNKIKEAM